MSAVIFYEGKGRRPKGLVVTHKRCSRCLEVLPLDSFNPRKTGGALLQSSCKRCSVRIALEFSRKNRDRLTAQLRAKRASMTPEEKRAVYERIPPEKRRQYGRDHYWRDADKSRARVRQYRRKNKDVVSERNREWRVRNPHRNAAKAAAYEARKKRAMPQWADRSAIDSVYRVCAELNAAGGDFQVDHIVPLCSERVCGLHVAWNLQVVERSINQSKSNRYWPDM